ncbi:MAG: trimeric autotransporter adhesin [Patescibacteria group bacterium]|nr:trimeric autotransporter adhesin [Patescibacteria group bacterium]
MKHFPSLRKPLLSAIAFFGALVGLSAGYAAYSTLTATTNEPLTITKWNEMLQYTVPPGAIMAFNGTSCPSGWDLADGTNDPAVGGGTNPMDLRGRFMRGSDSSATNDIDFASRTGGTGTEKIGSTQADAFKSHTHGNGVGGVGNGYSNGIYWSMSSIVPFQTNSTGGNETRPKNVAVLFCIKQ